MTNLEGWSVWPGLAGWGLEKTGWAGFGWAWLGLLSDKLLVWLVVWLAGGQNPSICRYIVEELYNIQK